MGFCVDPPGPLPFAPGSPGPFPFSSSASKPQPKRERNEPPWVLLVQVLVCVSPCAQPALPSAACKPELLKPTLLLMFHLIFILFFFLGKPSRIKAVPCQDNDGHYVACHFAMTSPQPLRAFSFTSCPPSLQPLSPRLFFGRELCRTTRKF